MNQSAVSISVVLPVYNEIENLDALHQSLEPVLKSLGRPYEILYCDDGSTDGSDGKIRAFAEASPRVKGIFFKRNFGQTAAINAGVDHARGGIVVLMDADRQNDPADIPKLLEKLDEGYDIVSGWRKDRKDPWLSKKLPSKAANWIIARVTGVDIHDSGCTLKAYRREVLGGVSLYGEMHRFIPVYGHWTGAKVGEVEVTHHPRLKGKSKYSLTRTFKVLLDLPLLVLLGNYITRPVHFFGSIGILFGALSAVSGLMLAVKKITDWNEKIHRNPLLLIAIFFFLAAIQMVMIGLLAELLTRIYHEGQGKKIYTIRETVNFGEPSPGRPEPDL